LSTHEDIEEAWLTARTASWWAIPECMTFARLSELDARRWDVPWNREPPLNLREKAEFRLLETLYPRHSDPSETPPPGVPIPSFRAREEARMQRAFAKYGPFEEATK
jgi:hypothetical protein